MHRSVMGAGMLVACLPVLAWQAPSRLKGSLIAARELKAGPREAMVRGPIVVPWNNRTKHPDNHV